MNQKFFDRHRPAIKKFTLSSHNVVPGAGFFIPGA
jgi:hypothetical protein